MLDAQNPSSILALYVADEKHWLYCQVSELSNTGSLSDFTLFYIQDMLEFYCYTISNTHTFFSRPPATALNHCSFSINSLLQPILQCSIIYTTVHYSYSQQNSLSHSWFQYQVQAVLSATFCTVRCFLLTPSISKHVCVFMVQHSAN